MREKFEKPAMEKIKFEAEDIIVTSGGGCKPYCGMVCSSDCIQICTGICHDVSE